MKDALFGVIMEFSALMLLSAVSGGVIGWLIGQGRRRAAVAAPEQLALGQRSLVDGQASAAPVREPFQATRPPQDDRRSEAALPAASLVDVPLVREDVLPEVEPEDASLVAAPVPDDMLPDAVLADVGLVQVLDAHDELRAADASPVEVSSVADDVLPEVALEEERLVEATPVQAEWPNAAQDDEQFDDALVDTRIIRAISLTDDVPPDDLAAADVTVVESSEPDFEAAVVEPEAVDDEELLAESEASTDDSDAATPEPQGDAADEIEAEQGVPAEAPEASRPTDPEQDNDLMASQQFFHEAEQAADSEVVVGAAEPLPYEQLYDELDDQRLGGVAQATPADTDLPADDAAEAEPAEGTNQDQGSEAVTLEEQIAELRDELQRKDLELMRLETGATAAWDTTVPELQHRIDELRSENDQLASELRQARTQLDSLFAELDRARQSQGKLLPDEGGA